MQWPNGAKIAVTLTFDFDAETLWTSRDSSNVKRPGTLSQGVFGAKVGVPNVLRVLRDQSLKSTFFIPGWVVEKYSKLVLEIQNEGHEIGHHGYLHEWVNPDEQEKEEEVFYRGLEAIENVTGKRPRGYRSPAWETSHHMTELLLKNDFLYSSNMMDDLFPYLTEKDGKKTNLVELPVSWLLDDAPFFMFSVKPPSRPIFPAQQALTVWKEEFDAMYHTGGLFNLVCHPQFIGRPSRIKMLNEFIQFMKSYSDVWFATAEEIAEYTLQVQKSNISNK